MIFANGVGFVVHTCLFFTLKNGLMIIVHIYKLRTHSNEYKDIKAKLVIYEREKTFFEKKQIIHKNSIVPSKLN